MLNKQHQRKYNYSFPITMGKMNKQVLWINFDKRCKQKLDYIVEHNKGEYISEGVEQYFKLSKQELIKLGFLAAGGLTDNYGKMRSWE